MKRDVLGAEDAAWLHMEDETNPMVVNGLLELDARLDPARLSVLLGDRLGRFPRLRARLVEPGHGSLPYFESVPGFEFASHVQHVALGGAADEGALQAFVGEAASALLDRDGPLWRIYAIDRPGAGTALLCRVHHSVADGFALLGVFLSLCEGGDAPVLAKSKPARGPLAREVADYARTAAHFIASPPDRKTALRGPLGLVKRVAWSEPIALGEVKERARAVGGTVNDVLVATVAGAIRRYLQRRGEPVEGLEMHAMVPVNLREGPPDPRLGNHFGLVILGLPVGVAEPLERLAEAKMRMDRIKATPEAILGFATLCALGRAPRKVENLGVQFFGRKASLVLTNVPGPRERVSLAGISVSRIQFWVPESGRMGLGVSIFSYAGEVTIGVIADAGLVAEPDELVACVHVEFAALGAGARARLAV